VSEQFRDRTTRRLVICAVLAIFAGHFGLFHTQHRTVHPDIGQVWFAARAVLHGQNPYALIGPGRAFVWEAPLFYPLPAALVALPIAPFPEAIAAAVFLAVGVFSLCWALTEHGYGPLLGLTSICMYQAAEIAQWSPLLAGATALAPLGVVLIAKPTIGAAVFAAKPTRWPIVGAAVLTILAFLLQPHWVSAWRDALQAASVGTGKAFPYTAPITQPGGFLAMLALLRWKRPEARLLAVMALVPQTTLPYEGLLLFLIPRGWKQALALSALSWANVVFVRQVIDPHGLTSTILAYAPTMVLFLYLPALLMVLRRPNEGPTLSPGLVAWLHDVHQRLVFRRRIHVLAHHIAALIPADARTVLDVGCGDGSLSQLVMQQRPELTITGLELKARPTTAIPVQEFDGATFPCADQSVDVVVFVDVLHHAENAELLLAEAARVARTAVVIKDHTADPWLARVRLWCMDWVGNRAHPVSLNTRYFTQAEWDQAFSRAGLLYDATRTQLGLYPWPARWLFERGLHFVARLTPAAMPASGSSPSIGWQGRSNTANA
jgi:SAM-dependent methyltransferase